MGVTETQLLVEEIAQQVHYQSQQIDQLQKVIDTVIKAVNEVSLKINDQEGIDDDDTGGNEPEILLN